MILIAAFAIYVILTKRLRITRSIAVTGDRARNFGVALLVLAIPLSVGVRALLSAVFPFLPQSVRGWPWPQALGVLLFCGAILAMAFYFRDQPVDAPAAATSNSAPPN